MSRSRQLSLLVCALSILVALVAATELATEMGSASSGRAMAFPPQKPAKKTSKHSAKKATEDSANMPALNFKMKDIDGNEHDLHEYYGNVIVIVNVASKCGFTPQYKELEALYRKYHDKGLVVLGFPANNFGSQEPGTDKEIKMFCTSKYDVTFPIFSKVSVKGDDTCDLYKYLTDAKADHGHGGDVEWNFTKFVISRDGKVAERFGSRTKPDEKTFIAAIDKELSAKIPDHSPLAQKMAHKPEAKKAKHAVKKTKSE